ncbi:uncharacterized protein Bfra_002231 [Botrytis fragariae]|uniref:Uncharacterized protein n=1 Tax=Botrytis fragariae TaxID=1964551 RepID=A0A8H6EL30_9HELO|nr:uncharacterized protein Bfra_002231 [Botrytis fragariae]KAF5875835.1 hypothetical protein Bfra_002231 [Botrytis fragariae]
MELNLTVPSSSIPRTISSTSATPNTKSPGFPIGNVTFLAGTLSGTKSGLFTSQYFSTSFILSGTTIISNSTGISSVMIESTSMSKAPEATILWATSVSISTIQVSVSKSSNSGKPSISLSSSPRTTSAAAPVRSSTITVPSSHVASTTTPAIETTTSINMF